MNELFRAEGLSKQFNHRPVLDRVGFTVLEQEVLGLIGPNGAGKTTLLECLAGLLPANAGTLKYRGEYLAVAHRKSALFYLPDAITPWAEQTVGWILRFFQRLYPQSLSSISNLLEPLRLAELMNARLGTLSKGERKRTLLAASLLTTQPLLLLDEPFDGLDLRQTRDVMTLLRAHASAGRTLLLSIHQLVDAGRVCDRLVLLSAGKVVGQGSISELRNEVNLPDAGVEEIFLALT
jgi:ABC-2 type transport system ATP-binding protein